MGAYVSCKRCLCLTYLSVRQQQQQKRRNTPAASSSQRREEGEEEEREESRSMIDESAYLISHHVWVRQMIEPPCSWEAFSRRSRSNVFIVLVKGRSKSPLPPPPSLLLLLLLLLSVDQYWSKSDEREFEGVHLFFCWQQEHLFISLSYSEDSKLREVTKIKPE